jgi:transcriptional regulator with XRE-family HTH domain
VRELRTAAAKTVAEAAEQAGMTEAEWVSVEEGRRAPTLRTLLGMARSLGCSPGEFLVGVGDRQISPNAEKAAALFEQCPADVQESILNLLRGVMRGARGKKKG